MERDTNLKGSSTINVQVQVEIKALIKLIQNKAHFLSNYIILDSNEGIQISTFFYDHKWSMVTNSDCLLHFVML